MLVTEEKKIQEEEIERRLGIISTGIEEVVSEDKELVEKLMDILRKSIKDPESSKRKSTIIDTINNLVSFFPPRSDSRNHLHSLMEMLTK